jgi:hypothetical protein
VFAALPLTLAPAAVPALAPAPVFAAAPALGTATAAPPPAGTAVPPAGQLGTLQMFSKASEANVTTSFFIWLQFNCYLTLPRKNPRSMGSKPGIAAARRMCLIYAGQNRAIETDISLK